MSYQLSQKVENLELSATDEVDNIIKRMKQKGITDIVSFGGGEPCFDTPDNIIQAAHLAAEHGKTKYEPTNGDYELRELIANKFKTENGIPATPEQIIVTPGGKFAIFLAFQAILGPGDLAMILDPAWVSYKSMANVAGASTIHVPSTPASGFQPDIDLIKKMITPNVKVIVVNTPCNPTGTVIEAELIKEIATIARKNNGLLLCDEVYEYLLFEGKHYSAASEFDNVITVNAFSKSYAMTGWRLGYVTGPQEILDGMIKVYQHSATCVTAFAQGGAIEAMKNPVSRRASNKMMDGYKERRDLTMSLIEKSDYLESVYPHGSFYAFPTYKVDMPSLDMAKLLLDKAHVATVPGSAFGACGEGHLRICFSTSPKHISEGFERINAILEKLASKGK